MIANFRSALPWWFYHTYVPIDYRIISYYVVSEFLSDPLFPRSSDNTTSRVPFHLTILLILYYIGVVVIHRNGMDEFRNELFDSLILVDSMLFDFWFSFFFLLFLLFISIVFGLTLDRWGGTTRFRCGKEVYLREMNESAGDERWSIVAIYCRVRAFTWCILSYIPSKIKNSHLPSLDSKIIFKRVYLFATKISYRRSLALVSSKQVIPPVHR